MTKKKEKYFIDLFAGCGGISLGMEQEGFKPILVNELNEDALNTYLINRPEYPWLNEFNINDVKNLTQRRNKQTNIQKQLIKKLEKKFNISIKNGDLDVLIGGPPCQGYSGIGHRRNYGVDKIKIPANKLYEDMAQLIIDFQPKIFLFENVRGLTNSRWTKDGEKGEIWRDVKDTFSGNKRKFSKLKNYTTQNKLLFAKNYGVPQNRPRIFIVGIRKDIHKKIDGEFNFFPDPIEQRPPNIEDILGDLIDKNFIPGNGGETKFYPSKPKNEIQIELRTKKDGSIFKKNDPLLEQLHSKNSEKVWKKWEYIIEKKGDVSDDDKDPRMYKTKKFSQRLLKKRWGNTEPNITVTGQPEDYIHYAQPRSVTVREWARLQTFPDWYKFTGPRTTGGIRRAGNPRAGIFDRELPKYTQIGNAVPVKLAREFAKKFKDILSRI
ncbi:DNA cytosine methyltransferase [Hyphomicrobiales bacterium]|nr:DNA cytosine methyltransferase [Hyphomicrobiales bacterium]|tara:strand:+ start:410 stop:1717 length:1308 start_codon:yes stop_codon:yes gene_type:complete